MTTNFHKKSISFDKKQKYERPVGVKKSGVLPPLTVKTSKIFCSRKKP